MSTIKLDGIKKALKAHSKETGSKTFTTQIQYKFNTKNFQSLLIMNTQIQAY